jgi:hypothetical protein
MALIAGGAVLDPLPILAELSILLCDASALGVLERAPVERRSRRHPFRVVPLLSRFVSTSHIGHPGRAG